MNELTGEEILALKPGTVVFAVKRRGCSAPSPNFRKLVVYEVGVEDNGYFIRSNRGVWGTWDSRKMNTLSKDEILKLERDCCIFIVSKEKSTQPTFKEGPGKFFVKGAFLKHDAVYVITTTDHLFSTEFRWFFQNYWDAYKQHRKLWG